MGNSNEKPNVKSNVRSNGKSNVRSRNGINIPPALLPTAKPPRPFTSEDDFFDTWTSWKEEFLMFKAMVNEGSSNKSRWADLMLNLMGPIGRSIFNTFVFSLPVESKDIDILIKKFDIYFIFSTMKRKSRENVYEYVNDLRAMTKKKGVQNEERVIKKKILTEIDVGKFTNAAKCFLPTFTFSDDFGKLTLKEIAFFWEMYNDHSLMKTCKKCGLDHSAGNCPAVGKYCERCNEFNHFRRRCPQIFLDNCTYCGGAHFIKKCPAYRETCTKCQKLNHFSWKCQPNLILSCRFCGSSHPAAKACCPARDNVCSLCHNIGHVPSKCNRTSHQQK